MFGPTYLHPNVLASVDANTGHHALRVRDRERETKENKISKQVLDLSERDWSRPPPAGAPHPPPSHSSAVLLVLSRYASSQACILKPSVHSRVLEPSVFSSQIVRSSQAWYESVSHGADHTWLESTRENSSRVWNECSSRAFERTRAKRGTDQSTMVLTFPKHTQQTTRGVLE